MGDRSSIEWTDATWNPTVGCSLKSPGCTNCYAMLMAARLEAMGQPIYRGLTQPSKAGPVWTGKVSLSNWGQVIKPLSWKRPRRIFVNSMSDLFHEDMPEEDIDVVIAVMNLARQHTYQVLTKRDDRLLEYARKLDEEPHGVTLKRIVAAYDRIDPKRCDGFEWPLPNLWFGVSVEDRARLSRIDSLRKTPAAKRFISFEPLLEDLGEIDLAGIDQVIIGGESGPKARDHDIDWDRNIHRQARAQGVAIFEKQLGAFAYRMEGGCRTRMHLRDRKGGDPAEWPEDLRVREFPTARPA